MNLSKKNIKFHEDIAIADTAFTVRGKTINKLFKNTGVAFTLSMADIDKVIPKVKRKIKLKCNELDLLLFDFLNELLFYKDTENLLFSKFKVNITKNKIYKLNANVYGEKVDPKKHKFKVDIKAITMHMFELKKSRGIYKARIVLDI